MRCKPRMWVSGTSAASAISSALAATLTAVGVAALAAGTPSAASSESGRPVVVVELFTSQGCSSCPPADRLLTRLGGGRPVAGADVVPLAFHVDYWNWIGWTDPFSSSDWSARQRLYARAFGSERIYTPQLVVSGGAECVGSDEREARRLIADAAARTDRALVSIERLAAPAGKLRLVVTARRLPQPPAGELEAVVAITESGHRTEIGRGENARRTLANDHVVRRLESVFRIESSATATRSEELELELPPPAPGTTRAAVAFLQNPATYEIVGAASLELPRRDG